ncbi:MAG: ABC transporter substrate-binding protein [bacterium]|nr:ABC transporter substrate-binding protein [bacterium]
MKRIGFLFVFALLALTVVIVGWRFASKRKIVTTPVTNASPTTTVSVALDWTPNTNHTGIYVAIAKGWYKEQGIDLRILPYSSTVTPDILVSSGKADFGISSTESVVANRALGQDVISVAAIIQHNTSSLAVLEGSDITSPKALDGKIYGGFGSPSEEAVVNAIIKKDGGAGTVKNIVLETGAMEALKAKRVDAVWIYDGWEGIQAKRDGVHLRTFPIIKFGIDDYYTPVIIASPTSIAAKNQLYKKFMTATRKGYEYATSHPNESAALLIANAPKGTFPDTGLVVESQEYLSPRYTDQGKPWGVQESASWQGYPEFLLTSKAILDSKGKPVTTIDFNSLYTNELLQ